jgi:hypothetical protein
VRDVPDDALASIVPTSHTMFRLTAIDQTPARSC